MAGANRYHGPRKGSMQIWPRKKAKRIYARIRNWDLPKIQETKILGFLGYKAGMTHLIVQDNSPNSLNKGKNIAIPATIIECPALKPLSIRFYKQTHDGLQIQSEFYSPKLDKEIKLKIKLSKTTSKIPDSFDDLRLVVYSQPKLVSKLGQKKPQVLELGISGSDKTKKLELAKQLLEKDLLITQVFKENSYLDVHGVTKGKGFQGTVKRFGVKIRQHKSNKTKRGVGTLGSWQPKRVQFTVAQAGQMGYHQRTEYNKFLLKIDNDPTKINPNGGFMHYGLINHDYLIIKGSVPGPAKRALILTEPIRVNHKKPTYEILEINKDSKQ